MKEINYLGAYCTVLALSAPDSGGFGELIQDSPGPMAVDLPIWYRPKMAISKWETIKAELDPGTLRRVNRAEHRFSVASKGRQIVANLYRERFIDKRWLKRVASLFDSLADADPSDLSHAFRDLCYDCLTLKGRKVPTRSVPVRLGRAIEEQQLVNTLSRRDVNRTLDAAQATSLVSRWKLGRLTPTDRRNLNRYRMTRYNVWVSWHEASAGNDLAFAAFAAYGADSVRASLGLVTNAYGLPILLLNYRTGAVGDLFRPTIGDAGLHLRFQPPPVQVNDHGMTRPWEDWPDEESLVNPLLATPMPEALHEPTSLAVLESVHAMDPDDRVP